MARARLTRPIWQLPAPPALHGGRPSHVHHTAGALLTRLIWQVRGLATLRIDFISDAELIVISELLLPNTTLHTIELKRNKVRGVPRARILSLDVAGASANREVCV